MTINEYCVVNRTTQKELCEKLDINMSYLSKIKYKQIRPSQEVIDKLASVGIEVNIISADVYNSAKDQKIKQLEGLVSSLKNEIDYLKKYIAVTKVEIAKHIDDVTENLKGNIGSYFDITLDILKNCNKKEDFDYAELYPLYML